MKVICVISFDKVRAEAEAHGCPVPEVGSEYIVIATNGEEPDLYYQFVGFPDDCEYAAYAFSTLPEATADEMQEETREAILV